MSIREAVSIPFRFSFTCVIFALLLGSVTRTATADDQLLIPDVTSVIAGFTSVDGWNYHPAMNAGSLIGLLAVHEQATSPAGSLSVVWYPKNADGSFAMQGFTGTPAGAVSSLCNAYSVPGLFANSTLSAGSAVPWNDGELVTTTGGIADSDPASLVADMLSPSAIQTLVESGSLGATAISAEEVEIGDDGLMVSQQRLKYVGAVLTAVITSGVVTAKELGAGGEFGSSCTAGVVTSTQTSTSWSAPGQKIGNACDYLGTESTYTFTYMLFADCTSGPMVMTGPTNKPVSKSCTVTGACPPKPPC